MAEFDRTGAALLRLAGALPENRFASPRAQELARYTGFVAQDIDTISAFCVQHDLLIVSRCPDFNANSYVEQVKAGSHQMKPARLKRKTGAHGVLFWGGRGYVSDYDLMCVHRLDRRSGSYVAVPLSWDGKSAMSADEQAIIGRLNQRLVYALQHGCNDNYVVHAPDGSATLPKNIDIGDEFLVFRGQDIRFVMDRSALRAQVYVRFGLSGWHAAYGH